MNGGQQLRHHRPREASGGRVPALAKPDNFPDGRFRINSAKVFGGCGGGGTCAWESTGNFPDSETTCAVFPRGERTRGAPAPSSPAAGRPQEARGIERDGVGPAHLPRNPPETLSAAPAAPGPTGRRATTLCLSSLHPRGDCDRGCPHLAEFLARVKPTLASDKTGMLASFLVTVGRFLLHLDGPPGRRQFFFRDVTEADVSDFLNGKSGCNPLKLLSSMASLVEQPPFAQGRYATSISGRATSLVPPPHRGMRPGLARPRSTGTDIPQQDNLDLPPKTRIHSRRTFPRQRREAWKPRR